MLLFIDFIITFAIDFLNSRPNDIICTKVHIRFYFSPRKGSTR